jgi:hypothetical protein
MQKQGNDTFPTAKEGGNSIHELILPNFFLCKTDIFFHFLILSLVLFIVNELFSYVTNTQA